MDRFLNKGSLEAETLSLEALALDSLRDALSQAQRESALQAKPPTKTMLPVSSSKIPVTRTLGGPKGLPPEVVQSLLKTPYRGNSRIIRGNTPQTHFVERIEVEPKPSSFFYSSDSSTRAVMREKISK